MSNLEADPPRWKDRSGQANLSERMAGRLVRAMGSPPVLSSQKLARIEVATREKPRGSGLVRWWPAVAVVLLVSGATFAVAAHLDLMPRWLRFVPAARAPAPSVATPKPRPARTRPAQANAPAQNAPAPALESAVEIQATVESIPPAEAQAIVKKATPAARLAFAKTRDELRVPPIMPSALAPPEMPSAQALSEWPATAPSQPQLQAQPTVTSAARPQGGARWLAEALHALRANRAPGAALALLDLHAAELRKSEFVHEAMVLRVEALLSLKRSGEALELLDGKALSNVAASRALLLTRAELRAIAGRCADSLGDFDVLLARAQRPDEQALYGRAVCRRRTGDKAGAQADFLLYQRQFPDGAHIRDVEKQLGSDTSPH